MNIRSKSARSIRLKTTTIHRELSAGLSVAPADGIVVDATAVSGSSVCPRRISKGDLAGGNAAGQGTRGDGRVFDLTGKPAEPGGDCGSILEKHSIL
jgi:hypothetical protein